MQQARFAMLTRSKPEVAERLLALAQEDINARWQLYEQLASVRRGANGNGNGVQEATAEMEVTA